MPDGDSHPNTENGPEPQQPPPPSSQAASTTQHQLVGTPDTQISHVVRPMTEKKSGERIDVDSWLSTLDQFYESNGYSSVQRIVSTIPMLTNQYKTWYEQHKDEIQDNWTLFCERLKQAMANRKPKLTTPSPDNSTKLGKTEAAILEEIIEVNFEKYSGVGDAKNWLLHTMNQFKEWGVRRSQQVEAIPLLLEGDASLWYVVNSETIISFEIFTKLLLQEFKPTLSTSPTTRASTIVGTVASAISVPDHPSTSHLQRTVADDIIKRPTYFRGSQDDVQDWLDKLEQRFTMAQWSDENKLQYISIHLQGDAYRWWAQTCSTIKTWSSFTDAVIRAFGSTRTQELAFEQLKWYKQTVNQSTYITQYYDKIIELCKKVDPAMPDSLKLKYLMGGIKESLKTQVALQDPKTTEAFLSSARKIEDMFAFTNTTSELIPKDITLNATNYQEQPDRTRFTRTPNDNFYRHNNQDMNVAQNRSTYYQEAPTDNNTQRQRKPRKFSRSNRRSDLCYNCGTPGHYARDCTRPHFQ